MVTVLTDSHITGSLTTQRAADLGVRTSTLEEVVAEVEAGVLEFDLGLSMVYWRKIPKALIDRAALGVINFHPAPLPEYKGTGGYNLAILEGLDTWAVTAHYVDEDIDTGEIIEVDRFSIDPERETVVTLEGTSMRRLLEQAFRVVEKVERQGRLAGRPNEGGRYISRREMEAMKEIRPGDDIDRKIRAFWFPPYAGATIEVDGRPYTLVNKEILATLSAGGATSLMSQPSVSDAPSVPHQQEG